MAQIASFIIQFSTYSFLIRPHARFFTGALEQGVHCMGPWADTTVISTTVPFDYFDNPFVACLKAKILLGTE